MGLLLAGNEIERARITRRGERRQFRAKCRQKDGESPAARLADRRDSFRIDAGLLPRPGDPTERFHDDQPLNAQPADERRHARAVSHRFAVRPGRYCPGKGPSRRGVPGAAPCADRSTTAFRPRPCPQQTTTSGRRSVPAFSGTYSRADSVVPGHDVARRPFDPPPVEIDRTRRFRLDRRNPFVTNSQALLGGRGNGLSIRRLRWIPVGQPQTAPRQNRRS